MLLEFFVWDSCVKKARNIYRGIQWRVGGSSFVCLAALAKSMWFILKTLRRFGRHIRYVWFDSNLLQWVSIAVVQISVRKVLWSSFCLQYFEFVIVARKYFSSQP